MILVRNIFQVKFGRMKEAVALWKEGQSIVRSVGHTPERVTTDLSGTYYTLVIEGTYPSLADYEKANAEMGKDEHWRNWYQKMLPLIDSGRRELYTVVN